MDRPTIRILGFRTTYHKRTGEAELQPRDWVKFAPIHDINTVTEEMVSHLCPPENELEKDDGGVKAGYMHSLWSQIEPHYKAWKEGTEVPLSGVPLAAWGGLTAEEAEVFRRSGIKTVEDISTMTEGQIQKVALPGVRTKKQLAIEFLASRQDTETASKVTALEEQNEALKAQMEYMAGVIAQMQESSKGDEPVKRGPGRPRKADVEEAA